MILKNFKNIKRPFPEGGFQFFSINKKGLEKVMINIAAVIASQTAMRAVIQFTLNQAKKRREEEAKKDKPKK